LKVRTAQYGVTSAEHTEYTAMMAPALVRLAQAVGVYIAGMISTLVLDFMTVQVGEQRLRF